MKQVPEQDEAKKVGDAILAGFLPHAVAPSILLILVAAAGFALSIIEGWRS